MKSLALYLILIASITSWAQQPKDLSFTKEPSDKTSTLEVLEQVPQYRGCSGSNQELKDCMESKIKKILQKHIKVEAVKNDLEPGVYKSVATFVIEKDRVIRRIEAIGESAVLNEEYMRVLNKLPKLKKPGVQKREPVNVMYSLPITIRIE